MRDDAHCREAELFRPENQDEKGYALFQRSQVMSSQGSDDNQLHVILERNHAFASRDNHLHHMNVGMKFCRFPRLHGQEKDVHHESVMSPSARDVFLEGSERDP